MDLLISKMDCNGMKNNEKGKRTKKKLEFEIFLQILPINPLRRKDYNSFMLKSDQNLKTDVYLK